MKDITPVGEYSPFSHKGRGFMRQRTFAYRLWVRSLRRGLGLWMTWCVALGILNFPSPVLLANEVLPEYKVKAAYLYNFLHFVEWPKNAPTQASQTVNILIVGDPAFRSLIGPLEQQTIDGKQLHITLVSTLDLHIDLRSFHMIYLARSKVQGFQSYIQRVAHLPLLTVGDQPDFAEAGGMIGFLKKRGKVKFVVNRSAMEKGNLSMRSKALRLAEEVIE